MKTSEQINEISAALSRAQGEMRGAEKDADNPFFGSRYSTLESVWAACRAALAKNGLAVVQGAEGDGERVTVVTRLVHSSGQWYESEISMRPLPMMIDRGTKERGVTPQSQGSAITYSRRYGLAAMVGVAPEDDDGNTASAAEKGAVKDQADYGTFEDAIKDVRQRKAGTVTVYTIETESGIRLDTLDVTVAQKAKGLKGTGIAAIIDSSPSKYGTKINAIAEKEPDHVPA
jgi:hypothetical protein